MQYHEKRAAVSVVVPCFLCTETIDRAIFSVAQQVMLPEELILVEDASPDDGRTLEHLHRLRQIYEGHFDITIVALEKNGGPGTARNVGWNVARQPYVAFLDADDAWHPEKIRIQYQYVASHDEVALCGHHHKMLAGTSDLPSWEISTSESQQVSMLSMFLSNPFVTPSVMLRRNIPYRFLDGRRYMEDHLLWMQISCAGLPVVNLSAELAAIYKFPFGESGLSSNIPAMGKADIANYRQIHCEGSISLMQLMGLMSYSKLKHQRRLAILQLRKFLCSFSQQKSG